MSELRRIEILAATGRSWSFMLRAVESAGGRLERGRVTRSGGEAVALNISVRCRDSGHVEQVVGALEGLPGVSVVGVSVVRAAEDAGDVP